MRDWYARLVARGWWAVCLVMVLLAAVAAAQWRHLGIEFQTNTLLDQKDPEVGRYRELHDTTSWGEEEFAVVCATGQDWVSPEGVALLRQLVKDLRQVPGAGEVMSVLDVPLLRQNPGVKPNLLTLAAGLLYLRDEDRSVNWKTARAELLDHELATGTLISADGRSVNVLVHLAPAAEGESRSVQDRWQDLVNGLREVQQNWADKLPEKLKLAGTPVVYSYIMERVAHDIRVFGLAAAVLFSVGLFVIYRRVSFVFLPLLTSVLPVIYVLGGMAVMGLKFTVITSNLPLLLFVITLPFTVYLMERYLEEQAREPAAGQATTLAPAAQVLWKPCVYSALTTMAGFGAFAESGILPVRYFGVLMAAGTGLALLSTFLFFPCAMRCGKALDKRPRSEKPRWNLAQLFARLTLARPRAVATGSAILLIAAIFGALRITAENKFTSYFWPSSEVYQGLEFIDRHLGGTSTLEIYLRAQEPDTFVTERGLEALSSLESHVRAIPEVGSVRSLPALLKELRKTFRQEDFPQLNDSTLLTMARALAPQLFRDILDEDGRRASLQVRLQETAPTLSRQRILDDLQAHLESLRGATLRGMEVETTGIFVLYANMLGTLIASQRDTLGVVVLAIFVMLLLLFRSFQLALVVLLPQALPAVTMLGVMGWCGIPLDLVTVMIAAVALGVGVDSAIQYTMRFREELAVVQDIPTAVERTHQTVGRAIWIATSIIVAGFAVLVLSDFFPSVWFGLFTGLAMLMSQFSALLTLPALFLWLGKPWKLFKELTA